MCFCKQALGAVLLACLFAATSLFSDASKPISDAAGLGWWKSTTSGGHIAGTYHDPENEFALLRNLAAARIVGFFPPMAEPPPSPWRWHDCEVTERRTAVS